MNAPQTIRHVLVAHDGQSTSDAALSYALTLARPFGARVTVLHAYEIPSAGAPEVLVLATDWIHLRTAPCPVLVVRGQTTEAS
jgi:nucleotide-binding universal stress UspA family protein